MIDVVADTKRSKGEPDSMPLFLSALGAAARRPAAWGVILVGQLALALLPALLAYRWFDGALDGAYEPGSQLYSLDTAFRTDHADAWTQLTSSIATVSGWLAFVAMMLGVFSSGGWLRLLLDPNPRSTRLFFAGGARYFGRFIRLLLLVLLLTHGVGLLFKGQLWDWVVLEGWMGWPDGKAEFAESERTVVRLGWAQDGLYWSGLSLVLLWAMFTRTRMVLQNSRSVLVAGSATFWLLLRHPLRTLRPMLLLWLVELALMLALGYLLRWSQSGLDGLAGTDSTGRIAFLTVAALSFLALALREILHGARYAAALGVSRRLVRPLANDPWRDRVGGPGGPQYPLEGGDEFSVVM